MPLLTPEPSPTDGEIRGREKHNISVTTKLTETEFAQVSAYCQSRQVVCGEWLRELVLRELRGGTNHTKIDELMLSELVGLRLMFINLLQPRDAQGGPLTLEVFDALLKKIKVRKTELTQKMLQELEVNGERSVG